MSKSEKSVNLMLDEIKNEGIKSLVLINGHIIIESQHYTVAVSGGNLDSTRIEISNNETSESLEENFSF